MLRLAVARLSFCSNSFAPRRTRSEDVALHEWHSGSASFDELATARHELFGVRRFLAERPDWHATILRSASAPPGGPLTSALFSSWLNEVEAGLKRGRFDAVYLSLHGACQAEGDPTADLTILRRVRGVMGPLPVVASFDWRANMSEEVAILLDGATSNHPTRYGSEATAAMDALGILEKIINGSHRPVGALARLPMLMVGNETAMHDMIDAELAALKRPVLAASVFTGFAWSDSPFTGASALVWADRDAGLARETAARLAMAVSRAPRVLAEAPLTVDRAIEAAVAAITPGSPPPALVDLADDPDKGGLLDTPDLLRGLQRAEAFGKLPGRTVFAAMHDPEIVAAARRMGLGATLSGNFGAQTTSSYGPSVPIVAHIQSMGHLPDGTEFVLLRNGLLDIVVLSRRAAKITAELLAACNCDLSNMAMLAVKSGDNVREAFGGLIGTIFTCECPGPSHPDLMQLPYHFVPAVRRVVSVDERHAAGLAVDLALTRQSRRRSDERRISAPPKAHQREGVQET